MTQQETIRVLKSRFEKIQASFDVAITYLDAEDIHAFRVEVKRLRAFLHLVSKEVNIKLPRRLHQFYRMVGEIRNLQLQEQRIRDAIPHQSGLPKTYLTLLTIETAAAIRRARKFAANRLSLPVEERQVLGAFTHPFDDDSLHSLRKSLKDLLYNHSYVEKESAHIRPLILPGGKESVSALTDLLGQFQDFRSGLALLQPIYIDQVLDADEKKMLEEIRALWEKDKEAIKNQVLSSLPPVYLNPFFSKYAINASGWSVCNPRKPISMALSQLAASEGL
jgi:CHAD domain-containing protein